MKKIIYLMLPLFFFASCKEAEETQAEEYVNWQVVNEAAFQKKYSEAVASTTDDIDTIRCYSLTSKTSVATTDFIVVEKLAKVDNIFETFNSKYPALAVKSPLLSSTVKVSYRGRLQPSTSYPKGMLFESTIPTDDYSYERALTKEFTCSGVVDGFATALINMKAGDHWMVYIPYQLAYGTTANDVIPAYSMLTFEIVLESYK